MFVKHVGKHGDRKVAIVFREVPGEEHMALVLYPQTLPMNFHDSIMKTLESETGQSAEVLGEVLFRSLLPDGRPMLETLHKEGMIKKVQTNQIVVTPNAASHVRLDELNKVINQMKTGEEAKQKMAELDLNSGLVDPSAAKRVADTMTKQLSADTNSALSDEDIARSQIAQAERMAAEAQSLLAESERLKEEAIKMAPSLAPPKAKRTRKTTKHVETQ
jgi:predicted RNase H-like HicB family nuclease